MSDSYAGKPCPKCAHARAASETAPEWQCPKCGVAYEKFIQARSTPLLHPGGEPSSKGTPPSTQGSSGFDLANHSEILVTQESDYHYAISDERGKPIGQVRREYGWGNSGFNFVDNAEQVVFRTVHPIRLYFFRMEVFDLNQRLLGAIEKEFSFLTKRFCVEDSLGAPLMKVAAPIWKLWRIPFLSWLWDGRFPLVANGQEVASVTRLRDESFFSKELIGLNDFQVEFYSDRLGNKERKVILAAAIYIDRMYFGSRTADNWGSSGSTND